MIVVEDGDGVMDGCVRAESDHNRWNQGSDTEWMHTFAANDGPIVKVQL